MIHFSHFPDPKYLQSLFALNINVFFNVIQIIHYISKLSIFFLCVLWITKHVEIFVHYVPSLSVYCVGNSLFKNKEKWRHGFQSCIGECTSYTDWRSFKFQCVHHWSKNTRQREALWPILASYFFNWWSVVWTLNVKMSDALKTGEL
jgi:hypothetical protein